MALNTLSTRCRYAARSNPSKRGFISSVSSPLSDTSIERGGTRGRHRLADVLHHTTEFGADALEINHGRFGPELARFDSIDRRAFCLNLSDVDGQLANLVEQRIPRIGEFAAAGEQCPLKLAPMSRSNR